MKYLFLLFIVSCLTACGQQGASTPIGKAYAELELKKALEDSTLHNVVNNKEHIIKDSTTAIAVAEPILFGIYGKDNITRQRPYEVYSIDNYWVLIGTLRDEKGGTFLIILDARNGEVIRITHGK